MLYKLINQPNANFTIPEQLLVNRGIALEDIQHFLNPTEADNLSPLLLSNIAAGANMLIKHLNGESRIHIFVDSDMDGFCSAALLLNYLYKWNPKFVDNITYSFHEGKQHGIEMDCIPEGVQLIIAPDSSTDELDKHIELNSQGFDILVLDHHIKETQGESPACIINPEICDYPNKCLSGAAVVFKFCQYLDTVAEQELAKNFFDLAAASIVSDMMDLRTFENQYLLTRGLKEVTNSFLGAMIWKNSFIIGDTLTPHGIAFGIAPFVNAINRSGTTEEKTLIFEAMLEYKAHELIPSTKRGCKGQEEKRVEQAVRTCTNVKNRQTKTETELLDYVDDLIQLNNLNTHKALIIKLDKQVDKNVIGLVANKIMALYKKPTAILNTTSSGYEGSARGYPKSGIADFRTFCVQSNLAMYGAGHENAFGLGILTSNYDKFYEYIDTHMPNIDEPIDEVDFIFNMNELSASDISDIARLKYLWGQNMSEPLIAVENIQITKDRLFLMSRDKKPTLKIELPCGVSCIKFKSNEEEFNSLFSESGCVTINIIGKCDLNNFNGNITPQIKIENYHIIQRQEYYF